MDILPSTSEIVESSEEVEYGSKMNEKGGNHPSLKHGNGCSIEDDINRLFEAINLRNSAKGVAFSHENSKDNLQKRAMKRPMRVGSPQVSGIGISEPVSLKQALRGLCISQASEMAAMKRLSRMAGSSRVSEASSIKRLYRSVVVEASGSGLPLSEGKDNVVEFALVPETESPNYSEKVGDSSQMGRVDLPDHSFNEQGVPCPAEVVREMSSTKAGMLNSTDASLTAASCKGLKETDTAASALVNAAVENSMAEEPKNNFNNAGSPSISTHRGVATNSSFNNVRLMKPIFRNKNFIKKKVKQDSAPLTEDLNAISSVQGKMHDFTPENGRDESVEASPSSSSLGQSVEMNSSIRGTTSSKQDSSSSWGDRTRSTLTKVDERSRSREKGEFSQSSKSSIGEYSSSTSVSENSSLSGSSRSGNRPHMSRDLRWEDIRRIQKQHGSLALKHFKMIKKLGCGDIGSVYLSKLIGTNCLFAIKVMDNEFLASRKKMSRAQTEREILQMLDHPFLPTLYVSFVSDKLSCLVMDYCPGGDLHVLRQKQPSRCFSEQAARFYAAEVLLALEYLHMLGVVYRDLKPENILVREDGHIMLSDFDLSLRCVGSPILLQSSSPERDPPKRVSSPCSESSCIEPFCLDPGWQVSCFTPRLLSVTAKSRKLKSELAAQVSPLPQLVVEPTDARSNSFVGTYEYLAPEIIKSEGHGSAVDWWTFGIFLFELLYSKTPFKGSSNEETLSNVVSRSLRFPNSPIVSFHARDLIRGLLIKEPENRLGSTKGAAEIKQHPFFGGLNWALIRCASPPELPRISESGTPTTFPQNKDSNKCEESKGTEECAEFEMF